MPAYTTSDTIVAPATVPGRSAIAIVRLSGAEAFSILLELVPQLDLPPAHRLASLLDLSLDSGPGSALPDLQEQALVTCHFAPYSYTGENLVEIGIHGNPLLIERCLAAAIARGARLAEAGEFTFRAFINGKLDLIQAEAVHDLINAGSSSALRLAQAALGGLSGRRVGRWQEQLLDLLSRIEMIHDYASDDLDASIRTEDILEPGELLQLLAGISAELDQALDDSRRSSFARHGLSLAIVGPPNVGKSTLFNALLGYERALVHHDPGTTRDYLSESVEFGGISFTLIDTAGQRSSADAVESAGVAHAEDWTRSADMLVLVRSADDVIGEPAAKLESPAERPVLHVVTRCDLLPVWPAAAEDVLHVSGSTGQGIPELRERITLLSGLGDSSALAGFTRRQAACIDAALGHLQLATAALESGMPMDAAAQDIHLARENLLNMNQAASRQDVIDNIFSSFCVGK